MQDEVIGEFRRRLRGIEMYLAPQQPHEITGAEDLRKHFGEWKKLPRKGSIYRGSLHMEFTWFRAK
jgi:hypothetical protein